MYNLVQKIAGYVLAVGFAFAIYASVIETQRLKVTEWAVNTPKWTNEKPIRIALLADIHSDWPWMTTAHVARIVARTNELKPDIILLLGDYIGTTPFGMRIEPDGVITELEKLDAPCGVYAVFGNHDIHDSVTWPPALLASKIPVLQNEARQLDCGGRKFWVSGLQDLWWQHANIPATLSQVTNDEPVIMAMHNPDSFAKMDDRVALSVAGHTHGGQIRLPFIGAVASVVPSKFGLRYVYGHVREGGRDLIVTSGLGCTGFPLRFLNPPEIGMVTLKAVKSYPSGVHILP